jgi:K+-transporting ATPase ATPase C chain
MLVIFTIICGGIYPALVTGVSQAVFPRQAKGSFIIDRQGRSVGSALIGQPFSAPHYFWPRPSATADFGYNPLASGGSNAGPTNPEYLKTVGDRVQTLRDSGVIGKIPAELVQASASGLDPHISPEAAMVQLPRVAMARGSSVQELGMIVAASTSDRQFGILGEPRVNLLVLNLKLDKLLQ